MNARPASTAPLTLRLLDVEEALAQARLLNGAVTLIARSTPAEGLSLSETESLLAVALRVSDALEMVEGRLETFRAAVKTSPPPEPSLGKPKGNGDRELGSLRDACDGAANTASSAHGLALTLRLALGASVGLSRDEVDALYRLAEMVEVGTSDTASWATTALALIDGRTAA